MDSYEFKKIDFANLCDVAFLMKKVARKRVSTAYLAKKYASPEADGQFWGYLAYEKITGKVTAVVAALPVLMRLSDGQIVRAVQICETFTLPEHAGRGLMTRLAKQILEEQMRLGTRLFFAVTNQNNVHGFVRKLGFRKTHEMQHFTIRISTFPLEAICRRLGFSAFFRWQARRILKPFLASERFVLPNSVALESWVGIEHDEAFFQYKSFSFNELCFFGGIGSWLKMEHGLLVGDVLFAKNWPAECFDAWLFEVKNLAKKMGLRAVIFQTHSDSLLFKKLEKHGSSGPSWSVCCFAANAEMEPFLEKMHFGYGDFDTF